MEVLACCIRTRWGEEEEEDGRGHQHLLCIAQILLRSFFSFLFSQLMIRAAAVHVLLLLLF